MKYMFFVLLIALSWQCTTVEEEDKLQGEATPLLGDEPGIEETINKYFDGWMIGDTTLVGEAMHTSCHLKFVRNGEIEMRSKEQYLSGFTLREEPIDAVGRIISIDVTRTAAAAKVEIEREDRLFADYFNLLKEGDRWYITDKVSTSIEK